MFSFVNYYSAIARLKAAQQTVNQLGADCPIQILAQRDMIQGEVDYYEEQFKTTVQVLVVFFIISLAAIGIELAFK